MSLRQDGAAIPCPRDSRRYLLCAELRLPGLEQHTRDRSLPRGVL